MVQRLAQAQHKCLGPAVHAVEDFRRNRDDRGDVDHGSGATGDEAWHNRVGQAHQRGDVEGDHVFHVIHRAAQQRHHGADPGVVDQQCNAGVVTQNAFNPAQIGPVFQVGGDHFHGTPGFVAQVIGQGVQFGLAAGDQNQVIPLTGETVGVDRADAGRSACDQGGAFGRESHVQFPSQ
ncbi:hypothetical protein D3C84_619120 [compost metagenome]